MLKLSLPRRVLLAVSRCDRRDLLDKLIGLSLLPEFQANHPRILSLVHAALAEARGSKRLSVTELAALLNALRLEPIGQGEDPPEDTFVTNVPTMDGDYLVFNSTLIAPAYSLARMLEAVFGLEFPSRDGLRRECLALLRLGDAIARRRGLQADTFEESVRTGMRWPKRLPPLVEASRATRFSVEEVAALGIDVEDLAPFITRSFEGLAEEHYYGSRLSRHPILLEADGVVVLPVPSYVSTALRAHLAAAISACEVPAEAIERFHDWQWLRWLLVDLPLGWERPLPPDGVCPEPKFPMPGLHRTMTVQFDEEKVAHLTLIGCDWRSPPDWVYAVGHEPSGFSRGLRDHLRACREALGASSGFSRGLSIVVYDSPGWSFSFDAGEDPDGEWFTVALDAHAFATLLRDPRFSLLDHWKMRRGEHALEASGVRLMTWPEDLNRWSIWREWDFSFRPEQLDLRGFSALSPDTSLVQGQVYRTRAVTRTHATPTPEGGYEVVERMVHAASPALEHRKPIFFVPQSRAFGLLRSVVETELGSWWVVMDQRAETGEERTYRYLVWQSATEWLLKLAESADDRLGAATRPLRILLQAGAIGAAGDEIEYAVDEASGVAEITLPGTMIEVMTAVGNEGERILVRVLAETLSLASGANLDDGELDAWTDEVTADPALKMMHVTASTDAGMAVDLMVDRKPFRPLQEADLSAGAAGMRERLAMSGVSRIKGNDEVRDVLRTVVDERWRRCRQHLAELDRLATLRLVSTMIEAVHRDRVGAERSALARTRLYAESTDQEEWAVGATATRDAAFRSYRVVAEMALSAAPLGGGRVPGLSDIDEIAAEVHLLIRSAEDSDAVRFSLVFPEVVFRPNGALAMAHSDAVAFTREFIAACLSESIAVDMDNYPKLFDKHETDPQVLEKEDDAMLVAYRAEFGVSMYEAARISSALQRVAVDLGTDVVEMRRSEILGRALGIDPEIAEADFSAFVGSFGLVCREAWDAPPPKPFRPDDVWPWFFERRLSLMLRPLLITSNEDDPVLVYGVRQLHMGLAYVSMLLEEAIWEKGKLSSPEAKAWVDAEINRRGEAFERETAEAIETNGWRVFSSQAMTRFGAPKKLGDLDVLAVSDDGSVWIVIECKWFGAARTPREIANWLQDYHGKADDKLDRHLQRWAWIERNKDKVATAFGLRAPERVLGRIATTSPVPLAFREGLPHEATVMTRRDLPEALRRAAS